MIRPARIQKINTCVHVWLCINRTLYMFCTHCCCLWVWVVIDHHFLSLMYIVLPIDRLCLNVYSFAADGIRIPHEWLTVSAHSIFVENCVKTWFFGDFGVWIRPLCHCYCAWDKIESWLYCEVIQGNSVWYIQSCVTRLEYISAKSLGFFKGNGTLQMRPRILCIRT